MTLKLQRATTWTHQRLKLGMVSSFDHTTCVQKLRGLRQKLDVLRVQTGPSLLQYKGFQTNTHMLQRHFIFLSLFQLKTFFPSNIQSHILKFQPFLSSFAIFHAFNDLFLAKWPWNWKALQPRRRKGWNSNNSNS